MKNVIGKLVIKTNGEDIECNIEGSDVSLSIAITHLLQTNEAKGKFRDIFTNAVELIAFLKDNFDPVKKKKKKK